jgi:hypothetical protein
MGSYGGKPMRVSTKRIKYEALAYYFYKERMPQLSRMFSDLSEDFNTAKAQQRLNMYLYHFDKKYLNAQCKEEREKAKRMYMATVNARQLI